MTAEVAAGTLQTAVLWRWLTNTVPLGREAAGRGLLQESCSRRAAPRELLQESCSEGHQLRSPGAREGPAPQQQLPTSSGEPKAMESPLSRSPAGPEKAQACRCRNNLPFAPSTPRPCRHRAGAATTPRRSHSLCWPRGATAPPPRPSAAAPRSPGGRWAKRTDPPQGPPDTPPTKAPRKFPPGKAEHQRHSPRRGAAGCGSVAPKGGRGWEPWCTPPMEALWRKTKSLSHFPGSTLQSTHPKASLPRE